MKIRLAAVDMDGTILTPMGRITEATAEAVRQYQHAGGEFLICTGRNYADASRFVEAAGIRCGYICMSGAAVYDTRGRLQASVTLTSGEVSEIMGIFDRHRLPVDLIAQKAYFTTAAPEELYEDYRSTILAQMDGNGQKLAEAELEKEVQTRLERMHFVKSAEDVTSQGIDVYKICANRLEPEECVRLKREFLSYPRYAAASSFPTNIEITSVKAQKGVALRAYAAQKQIPLGAVMTIGDSDNDLSMMSEDFGYTVAMKNAMDCVKEAAKYHTGSNQEDGVARAIRKWALPGSQG